MSWGEPHKTRRPVGWLSDEAWQEALREAVKKGDVILHERRQIVRQDGSTYYEVDLSYKED